MTKPSGWGGARGAAYERASRAVLCVVLAATSGCFEPRERFDEFVERQRSLARSDAGSDASVTDESSGDAAMPAFDLEPSQLDGTYLLAVSTPLGPTKPTVLLVEAKAARRDGRLELTMRDRHLSAADRRTPVEDFRAWRTWTIDERGIYETTEIRSITPPEANAVAPGVESESALVFRGQLAKALRKDGPASPVSFWCGTVDGELLRPIMQSLDGSTFTTTRVEDPDDPSSYPDVTINCDMDPAEPL